MHDEDSPGYSNCGPVRPFDESKMIPLSAEWCATARLSEMEITRVVIVDGDRVIYDSQEKGDA